MRCPCSDSLRGEGRLVGSDHVSRVRGSADGLHTSIFASVVIAGRDDVAVEGSADLLSVLQNRCACANLHSASLKNFDAINDRDFFKCHFDFQSKPISGHPGQYGVQTKIRH